MSDTWYVYMLQKIGGAAHDEVDFFIVVSPAESTARAWPSMYDPSDRDYVDCVGAEGIETWRDPTRSTCKAIGVAPSSIPSGVIARGLGSG